MAGNCPAQLSTQRRTEVTVQQVRNCPIFQRSSQCRSFTTSPSSILPSAPWSRMGRGSGPLILSCVELEKVGTTHGHYSTSLCYCHVLLNPGSTGIIVIKSPSPVQLYNHPLWRFYLIYPLVAEHWALQSSRVLQFILLYMSQQRFAMLTNKLVLLLIDNRI